MCWILWVLWNRLVGTEEIHMRGTVGNCRIVKQIKTRHLACTQMACARTIVGSGRRSYI